MHTAAETTATSAGTASLAIVGRQPIFDTRLRLYGYELLFRPNLTAEHALVSDGQACTARLVVNTFIDIGLENVVGSSLAFINIDRDFLLSEAIHHLPAKGVVLEILEHVPPDEEVLAALRRLVEAGYRLALDDFVYRDELAPFLALASIVKLDISTMPLDQLAGAVDRLRAPHLSFVAERVETQEDLEACRAAGFDLFQGYFLARPATLQRPRPPSGDRLTALQMLALLNSPNVSVEQVETAISRDVTLSYRLLRVVNSAAFSTMRRVDSLHQAIIHLGRERIRGWVNLLVLSGLSDKPGELLATGLVRARACETLGALIEPTESHAFFTAGLLSILDAVLDTPMQQIVATLPLAPGIVQALTERSGRIGEVLRAVIAYEHCRWSDLDGGGSTPSEVGDAYMEAIRWSNSMQQALGASGPAAGGRR